MWITNNHSQLFSELESPLPETNSVFDHRTSASILDHVHDAFMDRMRITPIPHNMRPVTNGGDYRSESGLLLRGTGLTVHRALYFLTPP
jgi:hypothetical protein